MTFIGHMAWMAQQLSIQGLPAIVPDIDGPTIALTDALQDAHKAAVSMAHMRRIRHKSTLAILVANFDKNGVRDYIGPSTLGEIAVAAVSGKPIFLIGDFPSSCEAELRAWGARSLHGNLARVSRLVSDAPSGPSAQLSLFSLAA